MNRLALKTYTDETGPIMYTLTGEMTDSDGQEFPVGESSTSHDRIMRSVVYYVDNYTPVTITSRTEYSPLTGA